MEEKLEPTLRYRGNIKSTTKGEFTIDATIELSTVPTDADSRESAMKVVETDLGLFIDKLIEVGKSKGLQFSTDKE